MKRILALLLCALMLAPLAACAGDNDGTTSTTAAPSSSTAPTETTAAPETELTPDLPDVKYEGTSLVFINRPRTASSYHEPWLLSEGYNGDIINDAVYDRNMYIAEKYGVTMTFIEDNDPAAKVQKGVLSNTDEYDVMYDAFSDTGKLAMNGQLYDIADFGYANYDMPWWDSNSVEGMTYNGKLYAVVSDISLMAPSGQRGMVFNRDLIRLHQMDDPYQLVKDNKWTLDKMISMITQVSNDLDGDQAMTDADRYGMLTETGDNSNAYYMLIASGVKLFETNGSEITASFLTDEKMIDVLAKWAVINNDKSITRNYSDQTPDSSGKWTFGRKQFAADHYLFINTSPRQFDTLNEANMESEYGIVPNPKYSEDQERYYHALDRYTTCLSIPASNAPEDLERLSVLLEDMAYKSSKTILPAYYDNVIALRRARVPELAEMIDIMKNSIVYDVSTLYTIDYKSIINEIMETGNAASTIKKYEKVVQNGIKTITTKLGVE